MNVPPVSVERVQKCVVNFEIYRFLKKAANLPHPPLPGKWPGRGGGARTSQRPSPPSARHRHTVTCQQTMANMLAIRATSEPYEIAFH